MPGGLNSQQANSHACSWLICVAIALPWLNPFALGPTPAMVQLLISWFCTGLALICMAWRWKIGDLAEQAPYAWLLAALVSCVLAILQFLDLTAEFAPWVNPAQAGEAFANLRQRNQFASLTNMGLAALVCVVSWQNLRGVTQVALSKANPWWPLFAAILLGAGNAASSSRTGLLQLAVLTLAIWTWGRIRDPLVLRVFVCTYISYVVATLLLPMLIGADFGEGGMISRLRLDDQACSSRLILWRNVIELIALRPLAGWGWGELDYAHFVTLYPAGTQGRFCEILDNAHNLPLHLAVELGIPVAVVVCGLLSWWAVRARPWAERDTTRQLAWGTLLIIGVHSLLEYPLWYGPFQVAAGVSLAILWLVPTRQSTISARDALSPNFATATGSSFPKVEIKPRVTLAAVAVGLLAGVAYTGWDYHRILQIYLTPVERAAPYRHNTLEKIRNSWLFSDQVQFAELTITPLTPENAVSVNAKAHRLLHFSPEAKVVEKLIQSARMLGRDEEARYFEGRFKVAYPAAYQRWQKESP